MALKRFFGAALMVSVLGFSGCTKPQPIANTSTPAPVAVATTPAPVAETPEATATETPAVAATTEATPAETPAEVAGTPAAAGGDGAMLDDFANAEGMTGYEEVLAMADSIPASSAASVAKGKELYAANCALCHGATGLGDGDGGKALDPPPRDLTQKSEYLYGHMELALYRTGMYGVEGTGMAPWDGLITPEDMWSIGHYIETIQK